MSIPQNKQNFLSKGRPKSVVKLTTTKTWLTITGELKFSNVKRISYSRLSQENSDLPH